jgi:hypothetical protein
MSRPQYFPQNLWPIPRGIYIKSIIELFPPIFILSNGKQIKGEIDNPSKFNNCTSFIDDDDEYFSPKRLNYSDGKKNSKNKSISKRNKSK